jgi:hypothetical protein
VFFFPVRDIKKLKSKLKDIASNVEEEHMDDGLEMVSFPKILLP